MLEFCQTVNPGLEDYEADGVSHLHLDLVYCVDFLKAWPTLLDDFVLWRNNKLGSGGTAAPAELDE
jgi:hypothetical protein